MSRILSLILFEIKKNVYEPMTLIMFIGLPLMLTFVLGNTFQDMLTIDISQDNLFIVYDGDSSLLSDRLIEYLQQEEVSKLVQYEQTISLEDAMNRSKEDKYAGYIIIPENTYDNLMQGEKAEIGYYSKYNEDIIRGIFSGFVEKLKLMLALQKEGVNLSMSPMQQYVVRDALNNGDIHPDTIDYYSIQSLLQMLVFATILGSQSLTRDYENDAYIRTSIAPIPGYQMLLAKILGSTFYVLGATIIYLLISKFIIGANINGDYLVMFICLTLFIFIMVGLGIIIGSLVKNLIASLGISIGIMMFFSSVSGSIAPQATHAFLQKLTPNYYAKNILFGVIYGYDLGLITKSFIILIIWLVGVYCVGILLQRRKAV